MDQVSVQSSEGGAVGSEVDVTCSTNLKDTNKQQEETAAMSTEDNQSTTSDTLAIKIDEIQETGVNTLQEARCNVENSTQNLDVTCVPSKSLLAILAYDSNSGSSEDSEPDSVDLIQDSKSSDSSDSDWEEIQSNNVCINHPRNYRDRHPSSGDTSDSNESMDDEMEVGAIGAIKPIPKKTAPNDGDLGLDDLPPVPDLSKLSINVKTEDCIQMGNISNIIDRLVTIESLPNMPAYDLDTLLFLNQGKIPLGHVYDVIGPVTSPIYVIRFNTEEDIKSRGITKGLPVYSAPNTEHTQFVFLKELLRLKGSDASWKSDTEVPLEFLDFSDDDQEHSNSKPHNNNEKILHSRKKKRNSIDKHKIFETTMNLKNEVNSARYKVNHQMPRGEVSKKNLKFFYHPPPPCHVRPQFNQTFNNYAPPNMPMPQNFNMPPPMFNMPQYPMMHFPPNPQFPPPTFGSPAIPPLPHMMPPHLPTQPPQPGYHPGNMPMLPLAVCKPVPHFPKVGHHTGVVPKMRLPRKYGSSIDYKIPNNSRPPREMNPFLNNPRQIPPGSYFQYDPMTSTFNKSPPNNTGGSLFKNS